MLIVDDNTINRKVFSAFLNRTGIKLAEASSGMQCLGLVKKHKYDIIFLDHMMPEMDGVETLKCMKQPEYVLNHNTPVIALTANAIAGAKDYYLEKGFDGYLSKPIDSERLEKIIEEKVSFAVRKKDESEPEKKEKVCSIPEAEGFSWKEAMKHFPDEKALYGSLKQFYYSLPDTLKTIEDIYEKLNGKYSKEEKENAINQGKIEFHTVKSVLVLLGNDKVSSLARELEMAAKGGQIEDILNKTPVLLEELEKMPKRLDAAVAEQKSDKPLCTNDKAFEEDIQKLLEAAKKADINEMDRIMLRINAYSYAGERGQLVEELSIHVYNLDAAKVITVLEKMK